jgi:hypothetical protein
MKKGYLSDGIHIIMQHLLILCGQQVNKNMEMKNQDPSVWTANPNDRKKPNKKQKKQRGDWKVEVWL